MIATTTLSFCLCLQTGPSATAAFAHVPGSAAPPTIRAAQDVVRLYSAASLGIEREAYAGDWPFLLAPSSGLDNWDQLTDEQTLDETHGADVVISLIVEIMGREFEYEGRAIRDVPGGRILVRGPEALHQRVRAFLDFLDGLVNAQAELTVDVVELALGAEAPFGGRTVVARADAEAWLEARQGTREHASLLLRPGRRSELDLSRNVPLVVDYDVEIAQAASIGDPIVHLASIGKTLVVRAVPTPDGTALSLVLKRTSALGEVVERSLNMRGRGRTEQGMIPMPASGPFQQLDLSNRSIALDAVLREDQALVLYSSIDLERDKRSEVVVLRLAGRLPWMESFPYGGKGEELLAFDLSYCAPPRIQVAGSLVAAQGLPLRISSWVSGGTQLGILSAHLREADADYAYEVLHDSVNMIAYSELGGYRLARDAGFVADEGAEAGDVSARIARAIGELVVSERMLDVGVELSRHGKWSTSPVRARVPLRVGHSTALVLGIEGSYVGDYDVEVAQDASVADAVAFADFEGLCLWLHASETPGGNVVLDLAVGATQNAGVRKTIDLGDGQIEQTSLDQLVTRQRVTFRQDAEGAWRTVLGGTASGGSASALRLAVDVAR